MKFWILVVVLSSAVCQCSYAQVWKAPSEAELWGQRTEGEKAAFIDGLCDAYKSVQNSSLGELFCKPLNYKGRQVRRFCAARSKFTRNSAEVDPSPGVHIFDQFYADRNHSDLPTWTVIGSYNDKACGESEVLPKLSKMQEKLLCSRQLINMVADKAPATTVAAQEASCKAIK